MEVHLSSIDPHRGMGLVYRWIRIVEFGDRHRGTARLAIHRHRGDVYVQRDATRPSSEIEIGGAIFRTLEIERPRFEPGGIHIGTQIHRRSPRQVVTLVGTTGDVDVVRALPTETVAREEQQVPVEGDGG